MLWHLFLSKLNLTFSRLLNSQEGRHIKTLYEHCIEDQGLNSIKNDIVSATEDLVSKDDATLKMTELDQEDDNTEPIMVCGYEDVKEPKYKSKTPKFKPNELDNDFLSNEDNKSEDKEESLTSDESKPKSSRFKSGCF